MKDYDLAETAKAVSINRAYIMLLIAHGTLVYIAPWHLHGRRNAWCHAPLLQVHVSFLGFCDFVIPFGLLNPPPLRQPLFVQSLTGLKSLFEAKEVAIHIFGKKAEGDLSRPFAAAPGMFGGASICYTVNLVLCR